MTALRKVQLQDPNDATRLAEFDNMFKVPITIDVGHHEVHEGDSYVCGVFDVAMAAADYIGLSFTTPAANKRIHLLLEFAAKAEATTQLIEIPGTLTNGSAATAYNRDRGSGNSTSVTNLLSYDSTAGDVMTGGTIIHSVYTWADKKIGASGRDVSEIILAPATSYGFKLIAVAGTNGGAITLNWYEHTDE